MRAPPPPAPLLLAAGYAPAYGQSRLDDPRLAPVRTALTRIPR
ncbi:hypothetical protein [Streptomyces vilmorinianum]|nr:hypothetical protein [Streptomyces vilmorinianum]